MSNRKWIGISAVLCIVALSVLIPAFCSSGGQIGIVLMHGKTGNPESMANAAGHALQKAGFLVETPEMPWSKGRYIDKGYEEALNEIDQAVERLRKKGADRIVVAGHSMGAGAALAYAAYHGKIDAVVMLAPGHAPDSPGYRKFQADVAKARMMIESGNGTQVASFGDTNGGTSYERYMKASIYFSYFNPEGLGAMSRSAALVSADIPVLYVTGSLDPLTANLGKGYAFDRLPENKRDRYVTVNADHLGTPAAAVGVVIEWLNEAVKQ